MTRLGLAVGAVDIDNGDEGVGRLGLLVVLLELHGVEVEVQGGPEAGLAGVEGALVVQEPLLASSSLRALCVLLHRLYIIHHSICPYDIYKQWIQTLITGHIHVSLVTDNKVKVERVKR